MATRSRQMTTAKQGSATSCEPSQTSGRPLAIFRSLSKRNTRGVILWVRSEPLAIRLIPAPQSAATGAVVYVDDCGVYRSDWNACKGHGEWADNRVPRGQALGHEPFGEVVTTMRSERV